MLVSKNEGLRQKKRKNRKLWIFAPESIRGQKDDQVTVPDSYLSCEYSILQEGFEFIK